MDKISDTREFLKNIGMRIWILCPDTADRSKRGLGHQSA